MNHAERYLSLVEKTKGKKLYSEYQAAFYLLSSTQELFDLALPQVSPVGIAFSAINRKIKNLEESQAMIVSIAQNLFTYKTKTNISPFEISRLGYPYMELAFNGIFIASGEAKVRTRVNDHELELYLDISSYESTKRLQKQLSRMMENGGNQEMEEDMDR